jgi:hypothetical protein
MRTPVLLVATLLTLTACADDDGAATDVPSASPQATAEALPTGKDDLELTAAAYLSPEGFAPPLRLELPDDGGWTSVHRGADGFDLGTGSVVVAFLVPAELNSPAVRTAVRDAATAAGATVTTVSGPFKKLGAASGYDVQGGQGPLVASRDGGIGLDATPGGRLQVYATYAGGSPLVVVVYAPDATRWAEAEAAVAELAAGVTFAPDSGAPPG